MTSSVSEPVPKDASAEYTEGFFTQDRGGARSRGKNDKISVALVDVKHDPMKTIPMKERWRRQDRDEEIALVSSLELKPTKGTAEPLQDHHNLQTAPGTKIKA
mmetsp:Transcript_14459/g.23923  ORF Transcript_14459/g.23923 Transcript_14459/m.23923 type:complete len:103 (+) Transcript_14459:3-311(+)